MRPLFHSSTNAEAPFVDGFTEAEEFGNSRIPVLVERSHLLHVPFRDVLTFGNVVRDEEDHIEELTATENVVDYICKNDILQW